MTEEKAKFFPRNKMSHPKSTILLQRVSKANMVKLKAWVDRHDRIDVVPSATGNEVYLLNQSTWPKSPARPSESEKNLEMNTPCPNMVFNSYHYHGCRLQPSKKDTTGFCLCSWFYDFAEHGTKADVPKNCPRGYPWEQIDAKMKAFDPSFFCRPVPESTSDEEEK